MKKILSVILCLLVLLSAASCRKNGEEGKNENASSDITSSDVASNDENVSSSEKDNGDSESKVNSNNPLPTVRPDKNNQSTNTQTPDKTSSQIKNNSSKDNSSSIPNNTGTTQTNKGEVEIGDREGFRGVDGKIIIENDYWGYQSQESLWPESACAYIDGKIKNLEVKETRVVFGSELGIAGFNVQSKYVVHDNSVYMYAAWWDNKRAPRPYFLCIPGDISRVIAWANGKAFVYNIGSKTFTPIIPEIETFGLPYQYQVSDDGKYITLYTGDSAAEAPMYVYNIKTGEHKPIAMVDYDKNKYSDVGHHIVGYTDDSIIFHTISQPKNEGDWRKWKTGFAVADIKTGKTVAVDCAVDAGKYTQMMPDKPYQFLLENETSLHLYDSRTNVDYSFAKSSDDEFSDMVVSQDRYIFARYKNAKRDSWETVIIDMKQGKLINVDEIAKAYGSGTYKGYQRTAARWISDTAMFVSYTDAQKHYYEIIDFKDYI